MIIIAAYLTAIGEGMVVTATTKTYNGEFAPKNAVAIWVVDLETDQYLSTVYLSTAATTYEGDELKNYTLYSAGENDYHPVKPLREDHSTPIEAVWDCITYYEQIVWDGDFIVWVEFSEESTFDPSGDYFGKTAYDTITIDRTVGYAKVTAPDTDYFSNFTITYDPGIGIKKPVIIKNFNKSMSYHYNPASYLLSITCNDASIAPMFLQIQNLKGQIVDKVDFDSRTIQWDMHTNNGQVIPSGTYFLKVFSNTGNRIGSVYPLIFSR
jgi:hypothetical protein